PLVSSRYKPFNWISPEKVINSFSTSTLVLVLSVRNETALVTIISCPQGLLIKRISKNNNRRMPKIILANIFNNLNLFFFLETGFCMSLFLVSSKQYFLNYKFIILITVNAL